MASRFASVLVVLACVVVGSHALTPQAAAAWHDGERGTDRHAHREGDGGMSGLPSCRLLTALCVFAVCVCVYGLTHSFIIPSELLVDFNSRKTPMEAMEAVLTRVTDKSEIEYTDGDVTHTGKGKAFWKSVLSPRYEQMESVAIARDSDFFFLSDFRTVGHLQIYVAKVGTHTARTDRLGLTYRLSEPLVCMYVCMYVCVSRMLGWCVRFHLILSGYAAAVSGDVVHASVDASDGRRQAHDREDEVGHHDQQDRNDRPGLVQILLRETFRHRNGQPASQSVSQSIHHTTRHHSQHTHPSIRVCACANTCALVHRYCRRRR